MLMPKVGPIRRLQKNLRQWDQAGAQARRPPGHRARVRPGGRSRPSRAPTPASAALRHSVIWEEYRPLRRRIAPRSPCSAASFATILALYSAVKARRLGRSALGVTTHRRSGQHQPTSWSSGVSLLAPCRGKELRSGVSPPPDAQGLAPTPAPTLVRRELSGFDDAPAADPLNVVQTSVAMLSTGWALGFPFKWVQRVASCGHGATALPSTFITPTGESAPIPSSYFLRRRDALLLVRLDAHALRPRPPPPPRRRIRAAECRLAARIVVRARQHVPI
jgi:hypothetical protein